MNLYAGRHLQNRDSLFTHFAERTWIYAGRQLRSRDSFLLFTHSAELTWMYAGRQLQNQDIFWSSGDLLWDVSLAALQCCKTTVGGPHVKIAPMCATLSGSDHSHAVWGLRQIFKPVLHQESKKFVLKSFPRMMFGKITFFLCYCSLGTVQKSFKWYIKKILSELVMISSIFQWTISQNEEHD